MNYNERFEFWRNNAALDGESRLALDMIADDENLKKEQFGAELEFGTAGIRGIMGVGSNRMNKYVVKKVTYALARYIISINAKDRGVVISYDTRNNSKIYAQTVANTLSANGVKVFLLNQGRPVPMLSFAVRHYNTIAGVMITASHNPKEYNGYKLYGDDGAQLNLEATEEILKLMNETEDYISIKENPHVGEIINVSTELDEAFLSEIDKLRLDREVTENFGGKTNIVYTPVHGTGYIPVTSILSKMGIKFSTVMSQTIADGNFPTVKVPNPEFEETLSQAISMAKEIGADAVFGTDPDCDRLGVAIRMKDGSFKPLSGNQVGVLLLNYIITKSIEKNLDLSRSVVVKSIVSTNLAKEICDHYGVEMQEVLVGFKFIGEKIKQWETDDSREFLFGFEESCGYLRGTHARDKDAVVASMLFAEMACSYQSKGIAFETVLDDIYKKFGYYIDKNFSKDYKGFSAFDEMNAVMSEIRNKEITEIGGVKVLVKRDYKIGESVFADGTKKTIELPKSNIIFFELEGGSSVCLRPSGTEPKLKVYNSAVGKTDNEACVLAEKLEESIRNLI